MKRIHLLCTLFLSLALAAPALAATSSLYVAPTGSDSNQFGLNTCQSATSPCKTPNAALQQVSPNINDTVNVYFAAGNYYSPPFAADGGSPTTPDAKALVDLEGHTYTFTGSLNLIGSTQQINPAGQVAGAIDGGVNGGATPYEGWVQIAIDGGWGNYAVDAGYAYLDGGVAVLINNALAGKFISITSGTGAGEIAPIVSNDSRVITYVNHSVAFGVQPPTPDGSTKYNLFANASHLFPYPADAGVTTGYTLATVWLGEASEPAPADIYPGTASGATTRVFAVDPQVTLNFLDIADAPQSAIANFEAVDNFGSGLVSLRYSNVESTNVTSCEANYGGVLEFAGDYLNCPTNGVEGNGGRVLITGDALVGALGASGGSELDLSGTNVSVYNSVIAPGAGTTAIFDLAGSTLGMQSTFIDTNNTTHQAIQSKNWSNTFLNNVTYQTDGGSGFLSCGASGTNSLLTINLLDAGVNLVSLDNAATWSTQTAFSTQDGGTAGVHATVNLGTGCTFSSY